MKEYYDAVADLKRAWNHFENAESDYITVAIYEIRAAEARVVACMERYKV